MLRERTQTGVPVPILPPELLSHIFSFVDSRSTLSHISRCSRLFYDEATPFLYRRLGIRPQTNRDLYPRLQHLITVFMRRPALADYVRHLSIGPRFDDCVFDEVIPEELPPEVKAIVDHPDRRLSKDEKTVWLDGYAEGSDDAAVGVLLCLLPRLRSLDLEPGSSVPSVLHVLSSSSPQSFRELQDICWFGTEDLSQTTEKVMFTLPAARRAFFHYAESQPDGVSVLHDLPSRSSSIEQIELRRSRLNDHDMSDILRVPRSLTSFIYDMAEANLLEETSSVGTIRQGLDLHKASLETLCLASDDESSSTRSTKAC